MPRHPRIHRPLVIVALAAVLAGVVGPVVGSPPAAAAPTSWAPAAAQPFSDPLWFPLREPARISCTYSNPGTAAYPAGCGGYHGYWAMDLLGDYGDPVHAAGAGIFHVGARGDDTCHASGTTDAPGTWAWVDHGGGVVTKYNHLATITATEGQLVTPATRIGTMGREEVHPCAANYIHFEVRTGGITGTRVDPGPLWACEGTRRATYPTAWGVSSWNDLPKAQQWTPTLGNDCLPTAGTSPSAPLPVSAVRGDRTVRVQWSRPATSPSHVGHYTISREVWGPSVGRWHSMSYRTVPSTQLATTFRGLDNGRTYRFRVTAHNRSGNSAWTSYVKGTPAAAPLAPRTDRNLAAGATYVRFGWYGSVPQGTPVTSYTAGIRYWAGSAWTPWVFVRIPDAELTHRWDGLRRGTTYQVTVRAHSAAGSSPWGTYRKLTTSR